MKIQGVHLIPLATDSQDSLSDEDPQLERLKQDLIADAKDTSSSTVLVFMRYSLLLHPSQNGGNWDDGYQALHNAPNILKLLHLYLKVKAVMCA